MNVEEVQSIGKEIFQVAFLSPAVKTDPVFIHLSNLGLGQQTIAKAIGMGQADISNMSRGKKPLPSHRREQLLLLLEEVVKFAELLANSVETWKDYEEVPPQFLPHTPGSIQTRNDLPPSDYLLLGISHVDFFAGKSDSGLRLLREKIEAARQFLV